LTTSVSTAPTDPVISDSLVTGTPFLVCCSSYRNAGNPAIGDPESSAQLTALTALLPTPPCRGELELPPGINSAPVAPCTSTHLRRSLTRSPNMSQPTNDQPQPRRIHWPASLAPGLVCGHWPDPGSIWTPPGFSSLRLWAVDEPNGSRGTRRSSNEFLRLPGG
jgi:hypothetical protein